MLKMFEDLSFQAFHCETSCMILSLSSNRISFLKTKSALVKVFRFLKDEKRDHKKTSCLIT